MKREKQKNKGISLIVLVITIIVMIILASAIIISLSNNGIIGKANEAVDETNLKQVQQAATLLWADAYSNGKTTQTDLETAVMEGLDDIDGLDLSKYTVTVTTGGVTVTLKGSLNGFGFYYDKPYRPVGYENDFYYFVFKSNNVLECYYYDAQSDLYYIFYETSDAEYQEGKIITEWGEMLISNEGKTIVDGEIEYAYTEETYRGIYYNVKYYSTDLTEFFVFKENDTMEIYDATTNELLSTVAIETESHVIITEDDYLYVSMDGKTIDAEGGLYRYNEYIANHEDIIPTGGVYITEDGILYGGEEFPQASVTGDIYVYGDYEYMYNGYCAENQRLRISMGPSWLVDETQNGWGVIVSSDKKEKAAYENIIESINNKPISSLSYTYYDCSNMLQPGNNIYKLTEVIDMTSAFENCYSLLELPESFSIPKNVTSIKNIFRECKTLTKLSDKFTISDSIIDMSGAFYGCILLDELPQKFTIGNNVQDMSAAFRMCEKLTILPNGFTIPDSVMYMSGTFMECKALAQLPDKFKLGTNIKEMRSTFAYCDALTTLPSNFVIPESVTDMYRTFFSCDVLTLPNNFTIPSKVLDLGETFCSCLALSEVTIVINANPTNYKYCFNYVSSVTIKGESNYLNEIANTGIDITVE